MTGYNTQEYLGFGAPNYGSICRNTDGKLYTERENSLSKDNCERRLREQIKRSFFNPRPLLS